eukprot:TRINITY_DN29949_c0_g1_i1.p1 TRINITY_DN29949_c0_g1~~TRINITY_DN29949_c0_g1_i1.p1  ORF type:complete len:338 (+),score=67.27 TRINITY_DN29949_c0_g1_i1:54-1016(+)
MGAVESCCSGGLQMLLMPAAGTLSREWSGFGDPEPDSLLRIAEVCVRVHDDVAADKSAQFLVTGLGAASRKGASGSLRAGPCRLSFEVGVSEASSWPGQVYVWVEDLQRTWANCLELEASLSCKIVQQAVCCADERRADALVLQDPGSDTTFVVNQAPKGYSKQLVAADLCAPEENLITVVDVMVHVPKGTLDEIERFYRLQLSAAVSRTKEGRRVLFADGALLRQSLTFCEDETSTPEDLRGHKLCIYLPTVAKFRLALAKCDKAGLLFVDQAEAIRSGEFTIKRLQAPAVAGQESVPIEFEHVLRSPVHPSYSSVGGS